MQGIVYVGDCGKGVCMHGCERAGHTASGQVASGRLVLYPFVPLTHLHFSLADLKPLHILLYTLSSIHEGLLVFDVCTGDPAKANFHNTVTACFVTVTQRTD